MSQFLKDDVLTQSIEAIKADPSTGFFLLAEFEKEVAEAKGEIYAAIAGTDAPQTARDFLKAQNSQEDLTPALAALRAFEKKVAAGTVTSARDTLEITNCISGAHIADGFSEVERFDNRVATVAMNARDYADLRKFGRDILDVESRVYLLKQGLMATIWGAMIITSRAIPSGQVFILGEPETLFPNGPEGELNPEAVAILHVTRP